MNGGLKVQQCSDFPGKAFDLDTEGRFIGGKAFIRF